MSKKMIKAVRIVKKTKKAKNVNRTARRPSIPAIPAVLVDRTVPMPDRSLAPATKILILEHIYWLGKAMKDNDKVSQQSEFDSLKILSKVYHTFACNPADLPVKYSSSSDNYPPKRHGKPKTTKDNDKNCQSGDFD